jgi:hypothetical protein
VQFVQFAEFYYGLEPGVLAPKPQRVWGSGLGSNPKPKPQSLGCRSHIRVIIPNSSLPQTHKASAG